MNGWQSCAARAALVANLLACGPAALLQADEPAASAPVFNPGGGPGWKELGEADFFNVNCAADTWKWQDGILYCTGQPIGVLSTKQTMTNFELLIHWRHMQAGGNSGVFVWATEESIKRIKPGEYPQGVEVQVLDHGYVEQYEKQNGKKPDWFTTNGDVFPVNGTKMKPFPPVSPNGERSFPTKNLSRGVTQWNHYYVRAINGEVRLWVNGEEVSGGTGIQPASGYLALESEGAPVEFKNIRLRVLP